MFALIVVVALVGAVYYFYQSSSMSDPKAVKDRCKNRSAEQVKAIRYFCVEGCLKKTMSDQEYDAMVKAMASQNFKQKAMDKIGLDESQISEIAPVNFEGYQFDRNSFSKCGKDNKWRSSCYQISWLFFSANQVYLYQNTFNTDEDGRKETTDEYFYKDITSFSTSSDTVETEVWDKAKKALVLKNVNSHRFQMSVMGEKFFAALEQTDANERAIQGMKAKLREKKS